MSVIQRIGGGFGILVLLLILVGGAAFATMNTVKTSLLRVTEQTTPTVVAGGELTNQLLNANRSMLAYHGADTPSELAAHRQAFETYQAGYQQTEKKLGQLGLADTQLQTLFQQANQTVEAFFKQAEQLFEQHQRTVELTARAAELRNRFNNTVSELAALLEQQETGVGLGLEYHARYLRGRIREGAEIIDRLSMLNDTEAAQQQVAALKELQEQVDSRKQRLQEISSESSRKIAPLIKQFSEAIQSPDGLAQTYLSILNQRELTETLVESSAVTVDQASRLLHDFVARATQDSEVAADHVTITVGTSLVLIVVTSLVAILVAVVISLWVSHSIRTPLIDVINQLQIIASGDMTKHLDERSKDEFGVLTHWVNDLIDKQRVAIQQLADGSEALSQAAVTVAEQATKDNVKKTERDKALLQLTEQIQAQSSLLRRFKI